MICFDPNATFEYILKEEREFLPEDQTVFVLKRLSGRERALIQDQLIFTTDIEDVHGSQFRMGTQSIKFIDAGVVDVRNLKFGDGKEYKHKDKKGPKLYDVIEYRHVVEITNAITEGSSITEKDQKN